MLGDQYTKTQPWLFVFITTGLNQQYADRKVPQVSHEGRTINIVSVTVNKNMCHAAVCGLQR